MASSWTATFPSSPLFALPWPWKSRKNGVCHLLQASLWGLAGWEWGRLFVPGTLSGRGGSGSERCFDAPHIPHSVVALSPPPAPFVLRVVEVRARTSDELVAGAMEEVEAGGGGGGPFHHAFQAGNEELVEGLPKSLSQSRLSSFFPLRGDSGPKNWTVPGGSDFTTRQGWGWGSGGKCVLGGHYDGCLLLWPL